MNKPIITIDGKIIEMKILTGRDWRILGEFANQNIQMSDPAFFEKHAEFIANFFDGVTADDVLNLPLEDIFPLYIKIRSYFMEKFSAKIAEVEKNAETGEVKR